MASKTFNLTEKRIEVLRWLRKRGGYVYVCAIMEQCLTRGTTGGGHQLTYSAQQATRAGAGYAKPMAEAGLLLVHPRSFDDVGWGRVTISPEGERVLEAFDRDDGTLEQRMAEARAIGPGRCWWVRGRDRG